MPVPIILAFEKEVYGQGNQYPCEDLFEVGGRNMIQKSSPNLSANDAAYAQEESGSIIDMAQSDMCDDG